MRSWAVHLYYSDGSMVILYRQAWSTQHLHRVLLRDASAFVRTGLSLVGYLAQPLLVLGETP